MSHRPHHAALPATPVRTTDTNPVATAPSVDSTEPPSPPTTTPAAPAAADKPEVTYGPGGTEIPVDRRRSTNGLRSDDERRNSVVDRRAGLERRVVDIGSPTGLERRRGPGRRRSDDRRSAEEGEMTDEQFEFVLAVDTYKRLNNRPFPTWTEVLEVVKQLGYRKVAASSLNLSPATARSQSQPTPAAPPQKTSIPPASTTPTKDSEFFPG